MPDTPAYIRLDQADNVGTIAMDRAGINCYDMQFMQELNDAIEQADRDPAIKVVLLKSASPKAFCVGADIKAFLANDTATNQGLVRLARAALTKIEASNKIFIAVIAGHCLGGGLEMAMACDLRFAAEGTYHLGLSEVKLGLMPGNGGSVRLPRLVGTSKAMELLITGENIAPQEAHRIGLLNRLFAADAVDAQAQAYAQSLAQGATLAIGSLKRCLLDGRHLSQDDALALEQSLVDPLYDTRDAAEGFQAFTEKRPPNYIGQ